MFRELLLLSPCLIGLFWSITLMIGWKKNLRTQNIGAVTLFICTINIFYWCLIGMEEYHLSGYFAIVYSFTNTGVYSLVWLFYQSMIDHQPFRRKDYAVFIPPFLIGMIFSVCLLITGIENFEEFLHNEDFSMQINPVTFVMYITSAFVNNLVAIVAINLILTSMIVRLVSYKDHRKDFFIFPEEDSGKHPWVIFYGIGGILAGIFMFLVGDFFYFIEDYIPFHILFPLLGSLLYFLGFHTYYLKKPN